jgi:peroxiredoxin
MKKIVTILIISLVLSFTFITLKADAAGQSNTTRIVLTDAEKNINEQTKVIKGSELTPDCKFPWTVQKTNTSGGTQVIEVNNGKLSFQIMPSRGMSIQQVTIDGQNPNWKSPVNSSKPASFVEVVIDRTLPCKITVRGKLDDASPNSPKLVTEISTVPGESTFQVSNTMDFAGIETKAAVSEKTTSTSSLAEIAKAAKTWEPSFKEWFGKPAPDITLTDITGKKHKISDYKGKNLILNFWATWCPPCRKEIPDFIELRKTTSEDELAILGISTEQGKTDLVKKFAQDQKMNYTILVDEGKLVPPYSKIEAIPTTYFIDTQGNIKFATIGTLNLEDVKKIIQAQ